MGSTVRPAPRAERLSAATRGPDLIGLFVASQFLPAALLFVPGAQAIRLVIRVTPYLASVGMIVVCWRMPAPRQSPRGRRLLVLAVALMALNLLHPEAYPVTGLAQVALQICIVAPAFWGDRLVTGTRGLERLLWLLFLANILSAGLGLLQVYDPGRFMPPEFTRLGQSYNADLVESLSYEGASGQTITRPPGLSDVPGGAAVAGATSALLGILLCLVPGQSLARRLLCLGAASVGLFVLYVTQVRSLFLMVLFSCLLMAVVLIRQMRLLHAAVLGGTAAALTVGAFLWAVAVGGDAVAERFLGIAETGLVTSYQENRGVFLTYTFTDVLAEYPAGAGVGRWGNMSATFRKWEPPEYLPIHAEIQVTGWILDGGILLAIVYSGALFLALAACYRMCIGLGNPALAYGAGVVFCLGCLTVGQSLAGPVFNTQLGIQFWLLAAALHGAVLFSKRPMSKARGDRAAEPETRQEKRSRPEFSIR